MEFKYDKLAKSIPNWSQLFSSLIDLNKQIIAAITEWSCLSGPRPCPQLSPSKLLGYLRSAWVRLALDYQGNQVF